MNREELTKRVCDAVEQQCKNRGFAAPVDVFMDIGVLAKTRYADWRFGRVPYLEKVCSTNLNQLALVLKAIRSCALERGYQASFTQYRQWGCKSTRLLRFSKSGDPAIERAYGTHYVVGRLKSD